MLFAIFHAKDTYVEKPTLLLKMAKYVNQVTCNLILYVIIIITYTYNTELQ